LFVADAIQSVSGADIAIVNGGFIRAGILQGEITVNMIENVAMWNDVIYLLNITGAQLDQALENGVSNIDTFVFCSISP
jgi:2',3'-cyclic-nucleotide 2'-phosphodiesterase (5'-nucleotidase family)